MATPNPRSAKSIIDDALKDNIWWEWLLFIFIASAGIVGVAAVVVGMMSGEYVISGIGSFMTAALGFPLRFARQLRADNIRVRLFELALAQAKSHDETVAILTQALGTKGGTAS